jgi:hypothetical protein
MLVSTRYKEKGRLYLLSYKIPVIVTSSILGNEEKNIDFTLVEWPLLYKLRPLSRGKETPVRRILLLGLVSVCEKILVIIPLSKEISMSPITLHTSPRCTPKQRRHVSPSRIEVRLLTTPSSCPCRQPLPPVARASRRVVVILRPSLLRDPQTPVELISDWPGSG